MKKKIKEQHPAITNKEDFIIRCKEFEKKTRKFLSSSADIDLRVRIAVFCEMLKDFSSQSEDPKDVTEQLVKILKARTRK